MQGVLTQELLNSNSGQTQTNQVAENIGLTNDGFVKSMLAQKVYGQPAIPLSKLISSYPEVKKQALMNQFAADDTIQSYIYAHLKHWFKSSIVGNFERGFSSEADICTDSDHKAALRLDHAGESLQEGDLLETVRLIEAVVKDQPTMTPPEVKKWLGNAKSRLAREENVKMLQVYTDKLIELNKKHSLQATQKI